jgi:hypothetical protein
MLIFTHTVRSFLTTEPARLERTWGTVEFLLGSVRRPTSGASAWIHCSELETQRHNDGVVP